jgi:hypothetical protein
LHYAKEIKKMTRNVRRVNNNVNNVMVEQNISQIENNNVMEEKSMPLVHENCNYSDFGFAAAVSGFIAFVGILIYALMI